MNSYRHIWRQSRSLITAEAHIRQYIDQRDIFGSTHTYSFLYARHGVAEELHRAHDNDIWRKLGKNYLKRSFVMDLLERGRTLRHEYTIFIRGMMEDRLAKATNEEIAEFFLQATQYHSRFRGFFKTSRGEFMSAAEARLRYFLKKNGIENTFPDAFTILITPTRLDDINLELLAWVRLLALPRGEKDIPQHLAHFPWLVAHTYDDVQIRKIFLKKYRSDRARIMNLRSHIRELQSSKRKLYRIQQNILHAVRSQELRYLIWLFHEMTIERMRNKGGWAGSDFQQLPLYREITRRTHIPIKDLYQCYRIEEVMTALQKQRPIVSPAECHRRRKAYVLWLRGGKLQFFSGQKAEAIIRREITAFERPRILLGQVACKGRVIGRVSIVIPGDLTQLEYTKRLLKKGNVLVSPMTQPNMVPFMRKASAIVTDEGGLTSHAAVVAREFNIPCIVGTEIATKLLHDGDRVEVDAVKGIVRKI